jgi:hypothetical protein
MSLLSEEQENELVARLEGNVPGMSEEQVEVTAASDSEGDVSVEPEEIATDEAVEAAAEETDQAEDEVEEGHNVPYARFKKVIDAKNGFADELEALREQMSELSSQQNAVNQEVEAPAYTAAEGDEYIDEAVLNRLGSMSQTIQDLQVQEAQRQLEVEVGEAVKAHPNVPETYLLQEIIRDPNSDAMSLAQTYSVQVGEIEEAAISRYLETQSADAPAASASSSPDIPPEVDGASHRTSSGGQGKSQSAMNPMESATEALLKRLEAGGF